MQAIHLPNPSTPPHTWTHDDPCRQDTDDDGARDEVRIHAEPGLEDLPVQVPELVVDLVENLNRAVPAGPDLVVDEFRCGFMFVRVCARMRVRVRVRKDEV